jgi:hypothetical protein
MDAVFACWAEKHSVYIAIDCFVFARVLREFKVDRAFNINWVGNQNNQNP